MCWFSPIKTFAFAALLISILSSCQPDIKNNVARRYFDLKSYFDSTATRLNHAHPMVIKTVQYNNATETKRLTINNWKNEFDLFISSDINKPAWQDSYEVTNNADLTVYKAKTPDLRTQEIMINRHNGKIKWILIYNHTKNLLYASAEKLSYYPDSAYAIEKSQAIKLMGKKLYKIKGIIN